MDQSLPSPRPDFASAMRHLREGLAVASASRDKGGDSDNRTPKSTPSSEHLDWATTQSSLRSGAFVSPQISFHDPPISAPFSPPRNISLSGQNPKYSLFLAPISTEELATYCFAFKGEALTFCTRKSCLMASHAKKEKALVQPGDIFILKSNEIAWSKWCFNSSQIDPDLMAKWSQESQTVDHWNHLFECATRELNEDPDNLKNESLSEILRIRPFTNWTLWVRPQNA